MMVHRWIAGAAFGLMTSSGAAAEDYLLSFDGTGMREYYCQTTLILENRSDAPLMEISGHLYLYIGDERVGRSKGTWFMNIGPGESATAVFEAPNAPCDAAERIEYVVGACRIAGPGFDDKAACAERMTGTGGIVIVTEADS